MCVCREVPLHVFSPCLKLQIGLQMTGEKALSVSVQECEDFFWFPACSFESSPTSLRPHLPVASVVLGHFPCMLSGEETFWRPKYGLFFLRGDLSIALWVAWPGPAIAGTDALLNIPVPQCAVPPTPSSLTEGKSCEKKRVCGLLPYLCYGGRRMGRRVAAYDCGDF